MITIVAGALDTDWPTVLLQNVMANGTLAGFTGSGAKANVLGPQTYDYWQPLAVGNRISVTLAVAATCDCFAIAAHDVGSTGATVQLQYSLTGAVWVTAATVTPANDDAIMVIIPPVSALMWGVAISAAPGVLPSFGIIYIGQRLVIPAALAVPYVPLNLAAKIELAASKSLGGQLLGSRIARKGRPLSFSAVTRRGHATWIVLAGCVRSPW